MSTDAPQGQSPDGPQTRGGKPPLTEDSSPSPTRLKPWASLSFRDFRLLWSGVGFSSMGLMMRQMVNLWLIYDLSGSAVLLGFTGLFQAAPLFTLGLFGGSVADAVDRRKLMLVMQLLNSALALTLGFLTMTGSIEVWHLFLATSLSTTLNLFNNPARMSLIPSLVPRTHLMNAITLQTTLFQGTSLLGPLLGGVLLAQTGAASVYFVNAALFIPVIVGLALMRSYPHTGPRRAALSLTSILEGLRFFFKTRVLLALMLLDTGATLFGSFQVMLPVFAKDVLQVGEIGYGYLNAAPALGAFTGSVSLLLIGAVRRQGIMVIASVFGFALCLALLGLSQVFVVSVIVVAGLGFFDSVGVVVRNTTIQSLTPDHMRGRVTSVGQIFQMGAPSLGQSVTGFTAGMLGAPGSMVLAGIMVTVVTIGITITFSSLRRLRT